MMKKLDYIALVAVALVGWILLRESNSPTSPTSSTVPADKAAEKIQNQSQSVLTNLEGQLEDFAAEVAADVAGPTATDPGVKGFPEGVPEDYAPQSVAVYSTVGKLTGDLDYRVKKFNYEAGLAEQDAKTPEAFQALKKKHQLQRREILARHKELILEFKNNTQKNSELR